MFLKNLITEILILILIFRGFKPLLIGTCSNPTQLIPDSILSNENQTEFHVYGNINGEERTGPSCYFSSDPDHVYSFSVNLTSDYYMYFEVNMTNLNSTNGISNRLTLSTDCNRVLQCSYHNYDKNYKIFSQIRGFLENGDYLLSASLNGYEHLNDTYMLSINLKPVKKPPPYGSCFNPAGLIQVPLEGLTNYVDEVSFYEFSYIDSVKPICSKYESNDLVISLLIPDGFEVYIELKTSNYDNKFDSLIAITDSDCQPLNNSAFCNDDSPYDVGLGSYLNGTLSGGKYKIVITSYNDKYYGNFYYFLNASIVKTAPFGDYGSCYNPIELFEQKYIPSNSLIEYEMYEDLRNFTNTIPTPSCSRMKLPVVLYVFRISNGVELGYDFQMSKADGTNKMDTVLELLDSKCRSLEYDDSWFSRNPNCNDDSNPPGGVSSRLNGTISSGEYRLLASVRNSNDIGEFKLKIKFAPI